MDVADEVVPAAGRGRVGSGGGAAAAAEEVAAAALPPMLLLRHAGSGAAGIAATPCGATAPPPRHQLHILENRYNCSRPWTSVKARLGESSFVLV